LARASRVGNDASSGAHCGVLGKSLVDRSFVKLRVADPAIDSERVRLEEGPKGAIYGGNCHAVRPAAFREGGKLLEY
jgi:hypothetical protein